MSKLWSKVLGDDFLSVTDWTFKCATDET